MVHTLLVFDDDSLILKSIGRMLQGIFDELLLAQTAAQAEELLSAHNVTHLLCDRRLAEPQTGDIFIHKWRKQWPSIQYAALMTGDEINEFVGLPSVDAVFPKPFVPRELRAELTAVYQRKN